MRKYEGRDGDLGQPDLAGEIGARHGATTEQPLQNGGAVEVTHVGGEGELAPVEGSQSHVE